MHASFHVQQLAPSDAPLLRALNALFGEAFDDPETYGAQPPSDAYLQALLSKEHVIALTAITGEELLGGLVAYELEKFERARSEIYIFDLAVAEAHRRRGIATALIERLREIARKRNAWVIYVQADYGDEPAIALYQKLAEREEVLHFDIAVDRTAPKPGMSSSPMVAYALCDGARRSLGFHGCQRKLGGSFPDFSRVPRGR